MPILPSHSKLSTTRAWVGPGEKSRKCSSWAWIEAVLATTCARSSRLRSADLPDGSPIIPVPPPTTTTGPPPWRWMCISPKTGTRCPAWSDGPLGSNPL